MNYKFLFVVLPFFFLLSCDPSSFGGRTGRDIPSSDFWDLDRSLSRNNSFLEQSNVAKIAQMEYTSETKIQYSPLVDISKDIHTNNASFIAFIDGLRTRLADASGGVYSEQEANELNDISLIGMPRNIQAKNGLSEIIDTEGGSLENRVRELNDQNIRTVKELWDNGGIKGTIFADPSKKAASLSELNSMLITSNLVTYNRDDHNDKNWIEHTLGNKSIGEIYPILQKFKNDALLSEAACHSFLAGQMGKLDLVYDQFDVLATSSSPFVLLGETFESEIALGAYSTQAKFSVSVGGSRLKIVDGKAKYIARASSIGEKKYTAKISVMNPLTGETESFSKEFQYTVGQPSVMVAADKMNVLYVGVDNPITVAAAGISTSTLKVSMSSGKLQKAGRTSYVATCDKPGKATITIKNTKTGKSFPFEFRVKKIPNPELRISMGDKKMDGLVRSSNFKIANGLFTVLENFDFDAKCSVESYVLNYTRKRQDPVEMNGKGGRFTGKVAQAIKQAKPGDQYAFSEVNVRCPGDKSSRRLNGMAFRIK